MIAGFKRLRRAYRHRKSHLWGLAWPLRGRFIDAETQRVALDQLGVRQENLIFVLGAGRSGTQLVTDLLDAAGDVVTYHEPNFREDIATMDRFRHDLPLAVRYWREFRAVEVWKRWSAAPSATRYCEVNGTLRYQAAAIRQVFPRAHCFLLARDPRGFVRSMMGMHEFYAPLALPAYALAPLPGDPLFEHWSDLSRFEKICWMWRDTYEVLYEHIPTERWLLLERLVSDYDYFRERLGKPAGIVLSEADWHAKTTKKSRNSSAAYDFPAWPDWTPEHRAQFVTICGPTMSKLGYAF